MHTGNDEEEMSGELQARACHDRGPPPPQTQTHACVLLALRSPVKTPPPIQPPFLSLLFSIFLLSF